MKNIFYFITIFLYSQLLFAHEGPAFPILVNAKIANDLVSIWADPDSLKGEFNLYIESDQNIKYEIKIKTSPQKEPNHLLNVGAQLVSTTKTTQNYRAIVPFDQEVMWNVEFHIKQIQGAENTFVIPVEVTPPGPNRLEFAIYFIPFILVGLLWIKIVATKRKISP